MYAAALLRLCSQVLHSIMGGMCVLCLYYAASLSNPDTVSYLFKEALLFGVPAALIVFFQDRYLDR